MKQAARRPKKHDPDEQSDSTSLFDIGGWTERRLRPPDSTPERDERKRAETPPVQRQNFDNLLSTVFPATAGQLGQLKAEWLGTREQARQFIDKSLSSYIGKIRRIVDWRPLEGNPEPISDENNMALNELTSHLLDELTELKSLIEEAVSDSDGMHEYHRLAAERLCNMLATVQGNKPLMVGIKSLATIRKENEEEFIEITTSIDQLHRFFEIEQELLNMHGFPMDNYLIREGFEALANVHAGIDSGMDVHNAIGLLKAAACALQDDLSNKGQTREKIIRIAMSIGGIIFLITNIQAQEKGSLSPVQATLSGHVASGIIGAFAAKVVG